MAQGIFAAITEFGFTDEQADLLRRRLGLPHFIYVSGPAGGGKTRAGLLLGWTYFQAYGRPYRVDGQDMSIDQIAQSAKDGNQGILFHDIAAPQDYTKAGHCLDKRMTAIGVAFDGPPVATQAHSLLLARLPNLAGRSNVIAIGVDRAADETAAPGTYSIDLWLS